MDTELILKTKYFKNWNKTDTAIQLLKKNLTYYQIDWT